MSMEVDMEVLKQVVSDVTKRVDTAVERQSKMIDEHYKLEKELVELRSDVHSIKTNVESLTRNINKIVYIVSGAFITGIITAFLTWVVKGGMQ